MPVDATLLKKISAYERKGYQPDEIVAGLKTSQNYPDLVGKITEYEGQGYSSQEILDGMRTSVTSKTTEDLRREFVRNTGTAAEQAKDLGLAGHTPNKRVMPKSIGQTVKETAKDIYDYAKTPAAPATDLKDWATRVVPESASKLAGNVLLAPYEIIKGQTDPLIKSFTEDNYRPGEEMRTNAANAAKGLAAFATRPLGFGTDQQGNVNWSPENIKEGILTDPAGMALAAAGIGRPTVNAVKSGVKTTINAVPEAFEVSMYKRGLKGQTGFNGLKMEEYNRRVNTALDEGIPLTPKGVEKLKTTVDEINTEIQGRIKDYADSGATVNVDKATEPVAAVRGQAKNQAFPNKANAQINNTVNEFKNNPNIGEQAFDGVTTRPTNEIPIDQAQAFKQSINRELNEFYDAMNKSPDKAGYLARQWVAKTKAKIADGLRAQISEIFPEVQELNAREAGLIQLNKSLERAVNRIGQRDILSLKFLQALTHSPKTAIAEFILNNPSVQSNLAIGIRSLRNKANGVPKPGSNYTPPTINPRTPPDNPQGGGGGKVNTLGIPKGEQRTFDPTIGASRTDAKGMQGVNSAGLPMGEATAFDPTLGVQTPQPRGMTGVNSGNIPKGEPTAYDPTLGATRPASGGTSGSRGIAGATQTNTYFDPIVGATTTSRPSGMTGVNSLSQFTDTPSSIVPPSTAKPTWQEFSKGKMGTYMKEEGGHGGAMKRLSKEYRAIVQDIQNKLAEQRGSFSLRERPTHDNLETAAVRGADSQALQNMNPSLKPVTKMTPQEALELRRNGTVGTDKVMFRQGDAAYVIDPKAVQAMYGGTPAEAVRAAKRDIANGNESALLGYPEKGSLDAAVTKQGEVVTDLNQMRTEADNGNLAWAASGEPNELLPKAEGVAKTIQEATNGQGKENPQGQGYADEGYANANEGRQEGLLNNTGALADIPVTAPKAPSLTVQLRTLQQALHDATTPEAHRAALANLDAFIGELEQHATKGVSAP